MAFTIRRNLRISFFCCLRRIASLVRKGTANRILCEVTEENAAGAEKNCLQFRPLNRILLVLPAQREPDNNQ